MDMAKLNLEAMSFEYVKAIKNVAETIAANGYDNRIPPWPGTFYFEDISSESGFELIGIIMAIALSHGALELCKPEVEGGGRRTA